jgi:hypothetical protein
LASIDARKSARIVPLRRFLRIGRAHQVAVARDRVVALEHLDEHRPEIMNSTRSLKNGRHALSMFVFAVRCEASAS